jgi:hypothetical protein
MSDDEFVAGYRDGRDPASPEPNGNRSHSYRHSFAVGRAERAGKPIDAATSRNAADVAALKDARS